MSDQRPLEQLAACNCEGPQKIGPGFHSPICARVASRHTPGPWTILGHEDDNGNWSSLEVAMEQMPFMRVCFMTSDGPNMENARLIAAAPDLLALARQYASECAECGGGAEIVKNDRFGDPEHDYSVPCGACEEIWAVIHEAEGRK